MSSEWFFLLPDTTHESLTTFLSELEQFDKVRKIKKPTNQGFAGF
jgi:hypothetical protein